MARRLAERGVAFALCSLSGNVREIFEVSGFDRVVAVHRTRDDAEFTKLTILNQKVKNVSGREGGYCVGGRHAALTRAHCRGAVALGQFRMVESVGDAVDQIGEGLILIEIHVTSSPRADCEA